MSDGFSPPAQVRKNAARALELRKEHNRGMTQVGVARARDLSNGKNISADTIKRMHSYFARHEVDKKGKDWANQSNPSAGYIAWLGWGGDAGRSWVNGIIKKLNAKESEEISENMGSHKAAVVRGIFIRPGVSKNRRLYTKENISKAIERMTAQMENGDGLPITMATSHGAAYGDDALSTVGRVVSVRQLEDGSGMFEAEIANTTAGRDVAALAVGRFIKGVSIRGEWLGEMQSVTAEDGDEAMTSPDLRIVGIDFTHSPGVEGAEVKYAALSESHNPRGIFESVEPVEVVEADKKPYGDVSYADPGYQSDKKKRYPIDTAKHVRAAWSYINQADNAKAYSATQLKRIKSKIKAAAKKFDIDIQEEYSTLISNLREEIENRGIVASEQSVLIAKQMAHTAIINAEEGHLLLNARGEDLATILRHDAGHDDWHAAHGDPPCKSPEDCARMAASYRDDEEDDMENEGSMTDSPNMECHECGTECAEDAVYCHACGVEIEQPTVTNSCEHCGAPGCPEEAVFCPQCGHPVSQAESSDDALTQDQENIDVNKHENAVETSAEESGFPVARTLGDADVLAIAQALASMLKPTESAEEADVAAEVTEPAAEEPAEAPAEEPVAEEPVADEAPTQENAVENTFTAEQVQAMITEAATKAALEAVEAARKEAVENYRSNGAGRKGLVGGSSTADPSDLSESEISVEALAEMSSSNFRKVQAEVWGSTPFFAAKFAQAERGF